MNETLVTDSNSIVPFELQVMASAQNYHRWIMDLTIPHMGERILELGSGIGTMSQYLPKRELLVLSDVEEFFVNNLSQKFPSTDRLKVVQASARNGLTSLIEKDALDTVVSFNVMEHVEDDTSLLKDLICGLKSSSAKGPKRIVTLVPAHQWALGEIDKTFGHYRRYSKQNFFDLLKRAGANPVEGKNYSAHYINSIGLIGWWINGVLLGKKEIGALNVQTFEAICPLYRPIEDKWRRIFGLPFGNSLVTVYQIDEK